MLWDAEAVGAQLAMSPRWVLAEARAGRLPHYRLGRCIRFSPAEITTWLEDQHRDDRRVSDPIPLRKPGRGAGSRVRVPTATPPARLYPVASEGR